MTTPTDRIALLEREARELLAFLRELSPADWQTPSACAGWTVADVVGHLTSVDFANRMVRGLDGDYSPPEGSPAPEQHDEDVFAQSIYQRAITTKERLGEGLLDNFTQRIDEAVALFRRVQPDQWDNLVYWPPGPLSIRTLLTQRISELTMHGWDIRSRLEGDYHLSDGSIAALLDTVDRAARRAFRPDAALSTPLRYRFDIAPPVSALIDVVLSSDVARVEPAPAAAAGNDSLPSATFNCDGETCVLVMYGRLNPEDAVAAGRLTVVEGDEGMAAEFGRRFVGG